MPNLNIPYTPALWQHRNKNYTGVHFKTGKPVLPEELNYMNQILRYNVAELYGSILGPTFLSDAFKVVAPAEITGNENSIVVKAGKMYCPLGELVLDADKNIAQINSNYDGDAYVMKATWNDVDPSTTPILTPTNTRTDLVVLVITRVEINSDIDYDIEDVNYGDKTANRLKLYYTIRYIMNEPDISKYTSHFSYDSDSLFRIPLATIVREKNTDFIKEQYQVGTITYGIFDKRDIYGEVHAKPMFKKVIQKIADIQGSGQGFNADKVDGKDVDDTKTSTGVLWTSKKTLEMINEYAKGIVPQEPVDDYLDPVNIASNPGDGYRVIVKSTDPLYPLFKEDWIYTYKVGDGYVGVEPSQGWLVPLKSSSVFLMYSIVEMAPSLYGSHWFDFGGISDHDTLANVNLADNTSTDVVGKKHLTDAMWKDITDRVTTNTSFLGTLDGNFSSHVSNALLDHPDGSVSDAKIGNRTLIPNYTTAGAQSLSGILNSLAKAVQDLGGTANWYDGQTTKVGTAGGTLSGGLTFVNDSTAIVHTRDSASVLPSVSLGNTGSGGVGISLSAIGGGDALITQVAGGVTWGTGVDSGGEYFIKREGTNYARTTVNGIAFYKSVCVEGTGQEIYTTGTMSSIYTSGSGAHIKTIGGGDIKTENGGNILSSGYLKISGKTKVAGTFYAGLAVPTDTTRLNYDGNLCVNHLITQGDVEAGGKIYSRDDFIYTGVRRRRLEILYSGTVYNMCYTGLWTVHSVVLFRTGTSGAHDNSFKCINAWGDAGQLGMNLLFPYLGGYHGLGVDNKGRAAVSKRLSGLGPMWIRCSIRSSPEYYYESSSTFTGGVNGYIGGKISFVSDIAFVYTGTSNYMHITNVGGSTSIALTTHAAYDIEAIDEVASSSACLPVVYRGPNNYLYYKASTSVSGNGVALTNVAGYEPCYIGGHRIVFRNADNELCVLDLLSSSLNQFRSLQVVGFNPCYIGDGTILFTGTSNTGIYRLKIY